MRKALTRAALVLIVFVGAGCGSSTSQDAKAPSPAAGQPTTTTPEAIPSSGAEGITLPEGAKVVLSQEPGPGTADAVMIAGVYALVSDGIAAIATAQSASVTNGPDGATFVHTELVVDRVLLGDESLRNVTVVSGQQDFAMETGNRYFVILGADTTFPGSYSFVDTSALFDSSGHDSWTTRDQALTMSEEELRSTLDRSRDHLASRNAAREAKITLGDC